MGRAPGHLSIACAAGALIATLAVLPAARAATVECPPGGGMTPAALLPGSGDDLVVTGPCTVGAGTYHYGDVNVYGGGTLTFDDAAIDFWATGILIENDGALVAGSAAAPIGTAGGALTIHLYGPAQSAPPFGTDPGAGGQGIVCKSPGGLCGIPQATWDSQGASKVALPGGVSDYFYRYGPLPYDDGGATPGWFGYKVLAVSYGGTLKLFGKKGASMGTLAPSDTGTSWVRLAATVRPTGTSVDPKDRTLQLSRAVDWEPGDQIVLTTTDYLPGHSEQLTIESVGAGRTSVVVTEPIGWIHNGERYDLGAVPARIGLDFTQAETRAAVGLLTRSIRIVSGGDAYGEALAADAFIGGHTIARAGFTAFQMQGVELYQLGQGGRIGHYPVHFHVARHVPDDTFVKDCSIHDSMTRWIVLHSTQHVRLERNVGYLSIGHGFYLEDGTETDNVLYANLGVFARAAVDNVQNPRKVPGILASPDLQGIEQVPFHTDVDHPTVFWLMNGWNDFRYNMAVGAGTCGTCWWLVPGSNSGHSRQQKWEGYASMQQSTPGTFDRAGMTPLMRFEGNSCSTAMNSFNVVGNTAVCHGVGEAPAESLQAVPNPLVPASTSPQADDYYPRVDPGGQRFATRCTKTDCSSVPKCAEGAKADCMVTVLDHYTSSFHWTETNFAAIWLRPQWYLVIQSVLSDVQNGGLTFVTGGDYTLSSTIGGHWALARRNAFIGQTQDDDPFASDAGPFNPDSGLACDTASGNNCLSRDEGVAFPITNFGNNQRLFNIYDGPAYQDSNAYLHVKTRTLEDCTPGTGNCFTSRYMYGRVLGIPRRGDECYMPNAAIGWKQPNGFYYPPAFHSRNLFFHDVDIRHFVIEPSFEPGTFRTNADAVKSRYCTWSPDMFTGFTDVDRQTELNDDDGSLTGLVNTISVNEDSFFDAPVETIECAADLTARTSPYDYVTTVVYPHCAIAGTCGTDWSTPCSNQQCYGVPLYRQYETRTERRARGPGNEADERRIFLMGESIAQRNSLTANHGRYYVDTTVGRERQVETIGSAAEFTLFKPSGTYYLFLLYAKPSTRQTYQLYVGEDAAFDPESRVSAVRVDLANVPLAVTPETPSAGLPWPIGWRRHYHAKTGILTVTMDMAAFAQDFADARPASCQPASFCAWQDGDCTCALSPGDYLYEECTAEDSAICHWSVKDLDCPKGGCLGFAVTLSDQFAPDPAKDPRPAAEPFPHGAPWHVGWELAPETLAGDCSSPPLRVIFGTERNDRLRGTRGDDVILGKGGNDRIVGRGGNDLILGGEGDDRIRAGAGDDVVYGGGGDDRLRGGRGDDVLDGGNGRNRLYGGPGSNLCTRGRGNRACR
jgi:hypothetical protein